MPKARSAMSLVVAALVIIIASAIVAGQQPIRVGIVPFDVANVSGATASAGEALGKIVRAEMIRRQEIRPEFVALPVGGSGDVVKRAADAGREAGVQFILFGTVLDATVSHANQRGSTYGRLPGVPGIGGSVTRTTAEVSLHVELIDPMTAEVKDSFEATGKETDMGVGADLITAVGSFSVGDSGWEKTPMGKALKKAAAKIADETARRTGNKRSKS